MYARKNRPVYKRPYIQPEKWTIFKTNRGVFKRNKLFDN